MGFISRIQHAWHAFVNDSKQEEFNYPEVTYQELGNGSFYRPDILPLNVYSGKSILGAIFNRIAIDVASTRFNHIRLDKDGRYSETIDSGLNDCLTIRANKDQTARSFIKDLVYDLLEDGCIAVVPIVTSKYPVNYNVQDIFAWRLARIVTWYPDFVEVEIYNDVLGKRVHKTLSKYMISIIENPLFAILNEPNSVAKKLARKLALLDAVDEQCGSPRMDLIVQLAYSVKSPSQQKIVEMKQASLEKQLRRSKFGIGYIDATDKVTQLNRPVENNIMKSVEYLTSMLYSQLGITQSILDGTADETTMQNYKERTIRPILDAIADEMTSKFLSKTAYSQGQRVAYFNEPFKLVPITKIGEITDHMVRSQVMTPNEIRQVIGLKPVNDPAADLLRNPNINNQEGEHFASTSNEITPPNDTENQNKITELDLTSVNIDDI